MGDLSREEVLDQRFEELLVLPDLRPGPGGSIASVRSATAYQWLTSAINVIGMVTGRRGAHWEQAQAILERDGKSTLLYPRTLVALAGVLSATYEDRKRGFLNDPEYSVAALTFDDFLDHASDLHQKGQIPGSSVLVAAVLEDTMKKIARKNGIEPAATLEPAIDDLVKGDVFTPIYAKRVKAWAAVRTAAFHARWEQLDLKSIGEAIAGTREMISTHLG